MSRRLALVAFIAACLSAGAAVAADTTPSTPPLRVIVEVPNDPAGRDFVAQRLQPAVNASQAPVAAAPAAAPTTPESETMSGTLAERLDDIRTRVIALAEAVPDVPAEVSRAAQAFDMMHNRINPLHLIGAAALFVVGGLAALRLAWWSARGLLQKIIAAPTETPRERLRLHAMRASVAVYSLSAYLVGSLGAFLLFPWPPIFRELVLILLGLAMVNRLAVGLGRTVLAPGGRDDSFRILPLQRPLAWFWYRWTVWLVTFGGAGFALMGILRIIGVGETSREVVAVAWLGLVCLAAIVLIWSRQHRPELPHMSRVLAVLLTAAMLVIWVLAVMRLVGPLATFIALLALPFARDIIHSAVRNVARLDLEENATNAVVIGWAVLFERVLRAVVIFTVISVIARAWDVRLDAIAMANTPLTNAIRAGLRVVVVLLVADVAWRLVRALIDGQLAHNQVHGLAEGPEDRRRARLATLLPLLRSFLIVVIFGTAALMLLDAVGIQIGPLLAGAGIVGVAVGFGAQTLVKDIISGIFYLLDDAFRVGEYVQTARYKGTVESFSLRSVKLRHHRGPITTVPFGELGAVQNLSRDWVIDKITLGVTYDTDLDAVKRIVKQIGKDLLADAELAPLIIETLKMQGVEQMGDYAIQIRMKMMTKPGEQFAVRRRAYALIKKAFEQNNIRFATPTVTVSGSAGNDATASAFQHMLLSSAQKAETPEPA